MLGKFGMWWKCNLLEDAARIPCIAAGPDFSAGKRVNSSQSVPHDLTASLPCRGQRSRACRLFRVSFPHYCNQRLWDIYKEHGDLPEHGVEAAIPLTSSGDGQLAQDAGPHSSQTSRPVRGAESGSGRHVLTGRTDTFIRIFSDVVSSSGTAGVAPDKFPFLRTNHTHRSVFVEYIDAFSFPDGTGHTGRTRSRSTTGLLRLCQFYRRATGPAADRRPYPQSPRSNLPDSGGAPGHQLSSL